VKTDRVAIFSEEYLALLHKTASENASSTMPRFAGDFDLFRILERLKSEGDHEPNALAGLRSVQDFGTSW
jgi:hypothetical protein